MIAADALTAASQHGYRVLTGSCPSIGPSGGYTQGGGHSPLSGLNGLSADNVLEWEVVTADGQHLVATPTQNQDLYWALSGGGGGTYAVVLSMTTRLLPDGPIGGGYLGFNSSSIGPDAFWDAIALFHAALPKIVDTGATVLYSITNDAFTLLALTAPDRSASQVTDLLTPLFGQLDQSHVPYVWKPSSASNYLDHYSSLFGPLPWGSLPTSELLSSRLIPRAAIASNPGPIHTAMKGAVDSGEFYLGCLALNATLGDKPSNSVLPAWRDTLMHCMVVSGWDWDTPYSVMAAREVELTQTIIPALVQVTPGSGTYVNEANSRYDQWQEEFYGENFASLKAIKTKYDPEGLFYAVASVGSEDWTQDANGRLCKI